MPKYLTVRDNIRNFFEFLTRTPASRRAQEVHGSKKSFSLCVFGTVGTSWRQMLSENC